MALTSKGKLSHQHGIWNCQLLEHSKILKNSVTKVRKKHTVQPPFQIQWGDKIFIP
jgi:hypothetical protein